MTRRVRLGLPLAAAALAILAWVFSPSESPDASFPDLAPDSDRDSSAYSGPGSLVPQPGWQARFTRAADGDSFTVRRTDSGREVELRLYGVDAPENGQPYAQASRRSLVDMVEGRPLSVEPVEKDSYGRTVAVVFTGQDPTSVNERQIERGMAWYYGYYCQKPFCAAWKAKERQARAERAGLWRDKKPVSPRAWRQDHHRTR